MAEGKEPHFISSNLLEALGGIKTKTAAGQLVDQGAYLWGVEDREKGKGILNHVLLTSRTAYSLGKELKEKKIRGYEDIDLGCLVHGAILHDVTKLYGEDREKLPPEMKLALGVSSNFREISKEVDEVGISWLQNLGYPEQVYEAIRGHDFPEKVIDNPYWKIILIADYMVGQKIMTIRERLKDVKTRWIDERLVRGQQARIEPERFALAAKNIRAVAQEIFGSLGTTDREFIDKNELNSNKSQTRWEKFLLETTAKGKEERAKRLVKTIIG